MLNLFSTDKHNYMHDYVYNIVKLGILSI